MSELAKVSFPIAAIHACLVASNEELTAGHNRKHLAAREVTVELVNVPWNIVGTTACSAVRVGNDDTPRHDVNDVVGIGEEMGAIAVDNAGLSSDGLLNNHRHRRPELRSARILKR